MAAKDQLKEKIGLEAGASHTDEAEVPQRSRNTVRKRDTTSEGTKALDYLEPRSARLPHSTKLPKRTANRREIAGSHHCSNCDTKFLTYAELQEHSLIHLNYKHFSCTICSKRFRKKLYLDLHFGRHTKMSDRKYKCNYYDCDKAFIRKGELELHIRSHTREGFRSCPTCNYKAKTQDTLNRHIVTHTKQSKFMCHICKYAAHSAQRLGEHARMHSGETPFSCELCPKTFKTETHLNRHVNRHLGNKAFECTLCEYKCVVSDELAAHMRTHTRERPYNCSFCTKTYSLNSTLRKHLRTHSNAKCEICGKNSVIFGDEKMVVGSKQVCQGIHLYLGSHQEGNFEPRLCAKSVKRSQALKGNMLPRQRKRDYKCSVCDSEFFTYTLLMNHIHEHTKEAPYRCKLCQMYFNLNHCLQAHMRKHTLENVEA